MRAEINMKLGIVIKNIRSYEVIQWEKSNLKGRPENAAQR